MNTVYHPPLALRWNRAACDVIYHNQAPPTVAARALAMAHTAMYDAWTCYTEENCVSTTTGSRLKRPAAEWTQQNRETAFSFAAYRVLESLLAEGLPEEHREPLAGLMKGAGCNTDDQTLDPARPEGIGNLSAKLVIERRRGDGSNQEGGYADYTGYQPANPPPPERLSVVEKWQPQLEHHEPQTFLTPHWGLVKPFALEWGGQFRPRPPVDGSDPGFDRQMETMIKISVSLKDEQKLIAEYWAGMHEGRFGGAVTVPEYRYYPVAPAQCCRIARFIAEKHAFANSNAIKMFFALANGLLDASIAVWDAKVHYDYCRPVSIIHELKDEVRFQAWGGPCRGAVRMEGEGWEPYLLSTPPHAGYPSAHSAFSRAAAEVIERFCGRRDYGESVRFPPHSSVIEPKCMPAQELTLTWPTLRDAAEQAGLSRRYGGVHFEEGDLRGRELGEKVAHCVWRKACRYFDGVLA